MQKQPLNILLVLADQHNASLMGCAGHPQVQTPNLDAFAASGMHFREAYCQNPICTPSRVSILSGQYCHNHGYYGLSGPAPRGLPNLMGHFKSAGYRTAAFGKLHLPNEPRNWIADDVDRFGDSYETTEGEIGKSDFLNHLEHAGLREWEDSWHNHWNYGPSTISHDAQPSQLPYEHTQEVWSARQAMQFIDEQPNEPFCIEVAFQKPHYPLLPNQRFWDLYPSDLKLPETIDLRPDHRPPHFQNTWHGTRNAQWDYAKAGEHWHDGARRVWRGTLACISQVDDVFGILMEFLDDRGLADNTIVVYSSDHGCYHTIHGLPEKAPGICSQEVCRVPLICRVPGMTAANSICDRLVELIDLVPTFTRLCQLPEIDSVDGVDISSLLHDGDKPLREIAVTENAWSKSVRFDQYRMVHYQPDMWPGQDVGELYDLANDPNETCNLYHDPGHRKIVDHGRHKLLDWLIRTTRVTTSHPPIQTRELEQMHPIAADHKATNSAQPRWRNWSNINYL